MPVKMWFMWKSWLVENSEFWNETNNDLKWDINNIIASTSDSIEKIEDIKEKISSLWEEDKIGLEKAVSIEKIRLILKDIEFLQWWIINKSLGILRELNKKTIEWENSKEVLENIDENRLWFEEKLDEIIENMKTEVKHSFEISQKELNRLEKFIQNIYKFLEYKDLKKTENIKAKLRFISVLLISYEKKLSLSSDLFDVNQKILNLLENNN